MIKKTTLLALMTVTFWAATGHATEQHDDSEFSQEYMSAYDNWRQLPLDLNANLRFAQAAMQSGYFDTALAAYDRVLILDEHNIEAQIQVTKIHINEQRLELAALQLQNINQGDLNKQQQQQVADLQKYLITQKISAKKIYKTIRAFNKSISIGVLYDSNVYADIGDKSFVLPAYKLDYQGNERTGNMAAFEIIHIDTDINLGPKFAINTAFDLYNKNYFANDHDKDLLSLRGQLTPRYFIGSLEISNPFALNGVFKANKNYANIYSAGINLFKNFKNKQFGVTYKYEAYKFSQQNSNKNSNKHNFGAQFAYMKSDKTVLYGKLNYGKNTELADERTDVNYSQAGLVLGINHKLNSKLFSKTALAYDTYKYSDYNKVFLNNRHDKVLGIDLGLIFAINNKSSLAADLNYQNTSSNQFLYQYDKTVLSMNYNYSF